MRAHKAYTVIEAAEVSDRIAEAIRNHARIEEVFEALKWRVARQPECGDLVEHEGAPFRLVAFAPIKAAANSQLLAKYTVDDDVGEIVIHEIFVIPYDPAVAYAPEAFDLDA